MFLGGIVSALFVASPNDSFFFSFLKKRSSYSTGTGQFFLLHKVDERNPGYFETKLIGSPDWVLLL